VNLYALKLDKWPSKSDNLTGRNMRTPRSERATSIQPPYSYTQKGRSPVTVLLTSLVAAIAIVFFLTRDPVFKIIGVLLVALVISGTYAFLKGETWTMSIADGVLSWSYARWPRSSGRIDLTAVSGVVVDDCSSTLAFTFSDGSTRKIMLIGHATRLRDYLAAHFPQVRVEFVKGT
jgi:hypothetical protein